MASKPEPSQQQEPVASTPASPAPAAAPVESGIPDDPNLPDESGNILEAFGLEADWGEVMTGLDARLQAHGSQGGQASSASAASAAEGESGAAAPAPAAPAQPQPTATPAGVSQPQPAPSAPAAPSSAAPAPAAGQTATEPSVKALQAQVQALQALLTQQGQQAGGQQPPAQAAPATPATPGQPSPEQLQDYRSVAIPPDVMSAINSEDPNTAAAGIHHLVSSMATLTHQRVMQHVDQVLQQQLSRYGSEQAVSAQQTEMQRDYYAAFPAHGDPMTRLVVWQEAQAMWQENPGLAWGQQARDALGARVNAKLGLGGAPQQPQQPAAQPNGNGRAQPAPKPAAMTEATNRPSVQSEDDLGVGISNILRAL